MYWFRRPPYLRWVAAVLLVATAAWLDLRPEPVVRHPFASVDITAGSTLVDTMIEWRPIPVDLLPSFQEPRGIFLRPVAAGEPLVPSVLSTERVAAPEGWWIMEAHLPMGAVPGQNVQLIVLGAAADESPQSIPGLVIVPPPADQDPFAIEPQPGLVAVPEDFAAITAAAIADGRVSAILGAGAG